MVDDSVVSVLSEIRAEYNLFDPKDEPRYRALSMAIEALNRRYKMTDIYVLIIRYNDDGNYEGFDREYEDTVAAFQSFDDAAKAALEYSSEKVMSECEFDLDGVVDHDVEESIFDLEPGLIRMLEFPSGGAQFWIDKIPFYSSTQEELK